MAREDQDTPVVVNKVVGDTCGGDGIDEVSAVIEVAVIHSSDSKVAVNRSPDSNNALMVWQLKTWMKQEQNLIDINQNF